MPQAPQYLVLTVSFFVIETVWQLIYTVSGNMAAWCNSAPFAKSRIGCGAIFIDCGEPAGISMHVLLG